MINVYLSDEWNISFIAAIFGRKTINMRKASRFILIYLLSGIAFFLLTQPFHRLLSVFTVTEVRPSAVLYPFLGISFGWPAALGIATANLIFDSMNGYSLTVLLECIPLQLLYTIVPYYLWKRVMRSEDHKHRLDCVERVLKFVFVCLASALLSALGVGMLMYFNFNADPVQPALFVLLNNFDMSVILGCPLMVLSNQIISRRAGTERIVTRNEAVILVTAAVQVLLMTVTTVIVYTGGKTIGTYDIWNTVFIIGVLLINATMLLSLVCMAVFGRKD